MLMEYSGIVQGIWQLLKKHQLPGKFVIKIDQLSSKFVAENDRLPSKFEAEIPYFPWLISQYLVWMIPSQNKFIYYMATWEYLGVGNSSL